MKIFAMLIVILISNVVHANDLSTFYEGRYNFLKDYLNKLETFKKKDSKFKGSVVETMRGAFYSSFGPYSQNKVDNRALDNCKKDGGLGCKVRFQSFKKNENYNRFAQFDSSKNILYSLDDQIKSQIVNGLNGIRFLKSLENFNRKDFGCTKNTKPFTEAVNIIKDEINIYPQDFLNKSGLKFIMICDDITSDSKLTILGLAPVHYDQTAGVFWISINAINNTRLISDNKINKTKNVFHHEYYHIIDSNLTNVIMDKEWEAINKNPYSNTPLGGGLDFDNSIKGFATEYSRNNQSEDKAELFTMLITRNKDIKKLLKKDEILYQKAKLLIKRLKSISPTINKDFWNKLN